MLMMLPTMLAFGFNAFHLMLMMLAVRVWIPNASHMMLVMLARWFFMAKRPPADAHDARGRLPRFSFLLTFKVLAFCCNDPMPSIWLKSGAARRTLIMRAATKSRPADARDAGRLVFHVQAIPN